MPERYVEIHSTATLSYTIGTDAVVFHSICCHKIKTLGWSGWTLLDIWNCACITYTTWLSFKCTWTTESTGSSITQLARTCCQAGMKHLEYTNIRSLPMYYQVLQVRQHWNSMLREWCIKEVLWGQLYYSYIVPLWQAWGDGQLKSLFGTKLGYLNVQHPTCACKARKIETWDY